MDPPAGFRRRHPLDPVHAALVLEPAVGPFPLDQEDGLLHAADLGDAGVHYLNPEATAFRVARVHADKFGGEERGLVPAGAGSDLEKGVLFVPGVLRDQQLTGARFQLEPLGLQLLELFAGQLLHAGLAARIAQHLLGLDDVLEQGAELLVEPRLGNQLPALLIELLDLGRLRQDRGIRQLAVDLLHPLRGGLQLGQQE